MNRAPVVLVLGLGLIGASFAQALKLSGRVKWVWGHDADPESIAIAKERQIIDGNMALEDMVRQADVIQLAVPVLAVGPLLARILPHLGAKTILTDVGSVKGQFARQVQQYLPAAHWPWVVPGHPIAGAERSGVTAAQPKLFVRHQVILTPLSETVPEAIQTVTWLWQACGARVSLMGVEHHDQVLAATSHIPHLLAFNLVDSLARSNASTDIFAHAAGGFRDFTRIAASNPVMWRDIFIANKDSCLQVLDQFSQDLAQLRTALVDQDGEQLQLVFARAQTARQHFSRILARRRLKDSAPLMASRLLLQPIGQLDGQLSLPGDVLLSQQLLMLSAMAMGSSQLHNLSDNQEVLATRQALQDLGILALPQGANTLVVHGQGWHGFAKPAAELYLSDTREDLAMMLGLLVAQPFSSRVCPAASGQQEQLQLLADLQALGWPLRWSEQGIEVAGRVDEQALTWPHEAASDLVELALLFLALQLRPQQCLPCASLRSKICLQMLLSMGMPLTLAAQGYRLPADFTPLKPLQLDLPTDAYLAGFYLCLALARGESQLLLRQLPDFGALGALVAYLLGNQQLDLQLEAMPGHDLMPLQQLHLRSGKGLQALDLSVGQQQAMDEILPLLMVLALHLPQASRWQGAKDLPLLCRDSLDALLPQLHALGAQIYYQDQDLVLEPSTLGGGSLNAQDNSRLALAMLLAAALAKQPIWVECVGDLSGFYPLWQQQFSQLGWHFYEEEL